MGLSLFDLNSKSIQRLDLRSEAFQYLVSPDRVYTSKNGRIYTGLRTGILSFDPDSFVFQKLEGQLSLTEFKIGNQVIEIGNDQILDAHIDSQEAIQLNHKQNTITLGYTSIDPLFGNAYTYSTRLLGLDSE